MIAGADVYQNASKDDLQFLHDNMVQDYRPYGLTFHVKSMEWHTNQAWASSCSGMAGGPAAVH